MTGKRNAPRAGTNPGTLHNPSQTFLIVLLSCSRPRTFTPFTPATLLKQHGLGLRARNMRFGPPRPSSRSFESDPSLMSAQDFRASNYLGFLHYPPRLCLDDILSAYYPRQPTLMGDNCFCYLAAIPLAQRWRWRGTTTGTTTARTITARRGKAL